MLPASQWHLLTFYAIFRSEYVRELIRQDEKRKAQEQLETLLLEGLSSEESELTREDWTAIRNEARARVVANKKRK